jgi:hypothetical protein
MKAPSDRQLFSLPAFRVVCAACSLKPSKSEILAIYAPDPRLIPARPGCPQMVPLWDLRREVSAIAADPMPPAAACSLGRSGDAPPSGIQKSSSGRYAHLATDLAGGC